MKKGIVYSIKGIVYSIIFVLILTSCKNDKVSQVKSDDPELALEIYPHFGSENLALDAAYTTQEGYKIKFTDIKFYFSEMGYGDKQLDQAFLFDYRNNGKLFGKVAGDQADFPSLNVYLGVHPNLNHEDPSIFPNESPLNIALANDMHWSWSVGYIFVKIEAKADTLNDAVENYNHNIIFHIGTDNFIQQLSFTNLNWVTTGKISVLKLKLDMSTFLSNGASQIDLKTEYTSHTATGQEALSQKVIENFGAALSTY